MALPYLERSFLSPSLAGLLKDIVRSSGRPALDNLRSHHLRHWTPFSYCSLPV